MNFTIFTKEFVNFFSEETGIEVNLNNLVEKFLKTSYENKTVIFVTHSIEEAVYVSDQIVLLSPRPGRISETITPDVDREGMSADQIRRAEGYLDTVENIWQMLKKYLD